MRALSDWLEGHPQLQVLGSIVISDTIDVVDVLSIEQLSTEILFHDETMLGLHPSITLNVSVTIHTKMSFSAGFTETFDWPGITCTLPPLVVHDAVALSIMDGFAAFQ